MTKKKNKINQDIDNAKIAAIREDLKNQLLEQNRFGKQFEDMIEDYIFLVKLKDEIQKDLDSKGIRYRVKTGNGFTQLKQNESVVNIVKVNNQMLKILEDLDLKTPELPDPSNPKNEESDPDGLL